MACFEGLGWYFGVRNSCHSTTVISCDVITNVIVLYVHLSGIAVLEPVNYYLSEDMNMNMNKNTTASFKT